MPLAEIKTDFGKDGFGLIKYLVHRLLMMIPVLLIVSLLVSSLIYFSPGDPVRVMLGLRANEEAVENIRKELGLDQPAHIRYLKWLGMALRGNLGRSLQRNEPVWGMIKERLGASVELGFFAFCIAVTLAIPAGVISATRVNSWIDNLLSFWSLFFVSMPGFWVAILCLLIFGLHLQILPISGRGGPIWSLKGLEYLLLPGLILGFRQVAVIMRLIRAGMLEILSSDYIRTARSKGLAERIVVYRHALRNAMIPTVTIFGLQVPEFLSLSVIIETVFAWPGMGRLLVDAVTKRDYTLVQGIVLVYALLVVVMNLLVDLLYAYIDPRIKHQ
ncbi:MAG: ABC transporter permease [Desulfobacteraceae bacterium]|nr:MAG: ABC transporter permease [Desulfobacteraceae bacterium]